MSDTLPSRAAAAAALADSTKGYILVLDFPEKDGITMMASADTNTLATAALGLVENFADDLGDIDKAHFLSRVASLLNGGPKRGIDGSLDGPASGPIEIGV